MSRIREAIAPYTRFVRTEQEKLTRIESELTSVQNDLRALRHRIGDPEKLSAGTTAALPAGNPDSVHCYQMTRSWMDLSRRALQTSHRTPRYPVVSNASLGC